MIDGFEGNSQERKIGELSKQEGDLSRISQEMVEKKEGMEG